MCPNSMYCGRYKSFGAKVSINWVSGPLYAPNPLLESGFGIFGTLIEPLPLNPFWYPNRHVTVPLTSPQRNPFGLHGPYPIYYPDIEPWNP